MKLLYCSTLQHNTDEEHLDCIKFRHYVSLQYLRILPYDAKRETKPKSFVIEAFARRKGSDSTVFERMCLPFQYNEKDGQLSCALDSKIITNQVVIKSNFVVATVCLFGDIVEYRRPHGYRRNYDRVDHHKEKKRDLPVAYPKQYHQNEKPNGVHKNISYSPKADKKPIEEKKIIEEKRKTQTSEETRTETIPKKPSLHIDTSRSVQPKPVDRKSPARQESGSVEKPQEKPVKPVENPIDELFSVLFAPIAKGPKIIGGSSFVLKPGAYKTLEGQLQMHSSMLMSESLIERCISLLQENTIIERNETNENKSEEHQEVLKRIANYTTRVIEYYTDGKSRVSPQHVRLALQLLISILKAGGDNIALYISNKLNVFDLVYKCIDSEDSTSIMKQSCLEFLIKSIENNVIMEMFIGWKAGSDECINTSQHTATGYQFILKRSKRTVFLGLEALVSKLLKCCQLYEQIAKVQQVGEKVLNFKETPNKLPSDIVQKLADILHELSSTLQNEQFVEKILDKKHAMYQFIKKYSVRGATRCLKKYFSMNRHNGEDLDTAEFNFYKLAQARKLIEIIRQLLNFIWFFRGSKHWWILYKEISTLLLSLLSCRRGVSLLAFNHESVSEIIKLLMQGENQSTLLSRDNLPLSAYKSKYLFPPCSPLQLANLLAFHVHALLAVDHLLETDSEVPAKFLMKMMYLNIGKEAVTHVLALEDGMRGLLSKFNNLTHENTSRQIQAQYISRLVLLCLMYSQSTSLLFKYGLLLKQYVDAVDSSIAGSEFKGYLQEIANWAEPVILLKERGIDELINVVKTGSSQQNVLSGPLGYTLRMLGALSLDPHIAAQLFSMNIIKSIVKILEWVAQKLIPTITNNEMKTVTLKKQVKVISLMSSCLEVLWNILSFVYQASPTLCYQNSPLIEVLFKCYFVLSLQPAFPATLLITCPGTATRIAICRRLLCKIVNLWFQNGWISDSKVLPKILSNMIEYPEQSIALTSLLCDLLPPTIPILYPPHPSHQSLYILLSGYPNMLEPDVKVIKNIRTQWALLLEKHVEKLDYVINELLKSSCISLHEELVVMLTRIADLSPELGKTCVTPFIKKITGFVAGEVTEGPLLRALNITRVMMLQPSFKLSAIHHKIVPAITSLLDHYLRTSEAYNESLFVICLNIVKYLCSVDVSMSEEPTLPSIDHMKSLMDVILRLPEKMTETQNCLLSVILEYSRSKQGCLCLLSKQQSGDKLPFLEVLERIVKTPENGSLLKTVSVVLVNVINFLDTKGIDISKLPRKEMNEIQQQLKTSVVELSDKEQTILTCIRDLHSYNIGMEHSYVSQEPTLAVYESRTILVTGKLTCSLNRNIDLGNDPLYIDNLEINVTDYVPELAEELAEKKSSSPSVLGKRSRSVSQERSTKRTKTESPQHSIQKSITRGGPRRDVFRNRKPNTSRPPSVHVDDFVTKLQMPMQQPPVQQSPQVFHPNVGASPSHHHGFNRSTPTMSPRFREPMMTDRTPPPPYGAPMFNTRPPPDVGHPPFYSPHMEMRETGYHQDPNYVMYHHPPHDIHDPYFRN